MKEFVMQDSLSTPSENSAKRAMPDVAYHGLPAEEMPLDKVGMENIELPIKMVGYETNEFLTTCRADAFINLVDLQSKGIHMSRLFLLLQEKLVAHPLSQRNLFEILQEFIQSHRQVCDSAFVNLRFDLPLLQKALVSDNRGFRTYPIVVKASLLKDGQFRINYIVEITYSSTCPCSAALARQLIQEKFRSDFNGLASIPFVQMEQWLGQEQSILATPHGQRSLAIVKFGLKDSFEELDLGAFICQLEQTLKTPVQTVVKREDEQEFARLNGLNLMFAEDAARRLTGTLKAHANVEQFHVKVKHLESLHPHDAVAEMSSGASCNSML